MPQTPDRRLLLPPYLDNPAWVELVEAIDAVLKTKIDDPTVWLARQRDLWILKDATDEKVSDSQMLADSDFELPEKPLLIRQANMLGFDFKEADLISEEDYQRIARNLSLFWYGKGKPNFIDFMGFVLNSIVTIINLWSNAGTSYDEYGEFLEEGDPGIGAPVWEGGEWYPTTHVRVSFDPFRFSAISIAKLVALFYAIANYNLVLDQIVLDGKTWVHSVDEPELARIVAMVPMWQIDVTIETTDTVTVTPYVFNGYVTPGYVEPTAPLVINGNALIG